MLVTTNVRKLLQTLSYELNVRKLPSCVFKTCVEVTRVNQRLGRYLPTYTYYTAMHIVSNQECLGGLISISWTCSAVSPIAACYVSEFFGRCLHSSFSESYGLYFCASNRMTIKSINQVLMDI